MVPAMRPTEQEFKKEYAAKRVLDITPIKAADSVFSPYGMDVNFISWIARTWEIDAEVKALIIELKNVLPDPEKIKAQLWIDYLKASEDIKAKMQGNVLKAFGMDKTALEERENKAEEIQNEITNQCKAFTSKRDLLADTHPMLPRVEETLEMEK